MIGKLRIHTTRGTVEAQLADDLTWVCADPNYALLLNEVCAMPRLATADPTGRASACRHHLYRVGERLGAQVEVARTAAQPIQR